MRTMHSLLVIIFLGAFSFPEPSEAALPFGDINGDGQVNVLDVQLMITLSLGIPLSPVLDADGDGIPDQYAANSGAVSCGDNTVLVDDLCEVDPDLVLLDQDGLDDVISAAFDDGYLSCETNNCAPDCCDKVCGDDGCGGSCGECAANEGCNGGVCVCQPDCSANPCGSDGCGGSCGGTIGPCGVCNGDGSTCADCAGVPNGSSVIDDCGVCGGSGIADGACNCAGDVLDCAGNCGGSAVADACGVCDGPGIPAGQCDCFGNGLDCANVCGGGAIIDDCGVCNGGNVAKDCTGTCYGNAVLDSCGVCNGGNAAMDCAGTCYGNATEDLCGTCNGSNACVDCAGVPFGGETEDCTGACGGSAVYDCDGKECGPDGCGGICGPACPDGEFCDEDGLCACVPDCTVVLDDADGTVLNKTCGSDGCGGSCGTCTGDLQCTASGLCLPCFPSCNNGACGGDDGCGGTCECGDGFVCSAGSCVCENPVCPPMYDYHTDKWIQAPQAGEAYCDSPTTFKKCTTILEGGCPTIWNWECNLGPDNCTAPSPGDVLCTFDIPIGSPP